MTTETENTSEPDLSAPWPKTAGGTVDWEVVFEDPESGLLSLITQANSAKALLEISIIIIKKIYTRKDDPAEVEVFVKELTELIPADMPTENLPLIIDVVVELLKQIKDFRIQKAAEHVAKLAEEAQQLAEAEAREAELKEQAQLAENTALQESQDAKIAKQENKIAGPRRSQERRKTERRSSMRHAPSTKPNAKKKKIDPTVVIGTLAVSIIAIGVITFFVTGDSGPPAEGLKGGILVKEIKEAAKNRENGIHVFGGPIRTGTRNGKPSVTVNSVPKGVCLKVVRSLTSRGRVFVNGTSIRNITLAKIKRKCERSGSSSNITFIPKK